MDVHVFPNDFQNTMLQKYCQNGLCGHYFIGPRAVICQLVIIPGLLFSTVPSKIYINKDSSFEVALMNGLLTLDLGLYSGQPEQTLLIEICSWEMEKCSFVRETDLNYICTYDEYSHLLRPTSQSSVG